MDGDCGTTMKDAGKSLHNPKHEVTVTGRTRQRRKSGRPRLDSPGAAVLSSDRRAQVRQAQKTYRLKKEATIESFKRRTVSLERRMKKLAELFIECHDSVVHSDLQVTHPALLAHLCGMRGHLAPEIEELGRAGTFIHETITNSDPNGQALKGCRKRNNSHNVQHATSFGYQVSYLNQYNANGFDDAPAVRGSQLQSSLVESHFSPDSVSGNRFEGLHVLDLRYVDKPLGASTPSTSTYSFHETNFSRRLQRYSLEHAYRLFIDSRSSPIATYRVFRLVPCMRDKTKMLPYFRKLVCAGVGDPLEIPSLPFYCIGKAGSHYPHKDHSGNLMYPSNMRLPRRILGIFPGAKTSPETKPLDTQSHLKLFGFDGDWFDCQDVQGYMEENGVVLDQSSLFAKVHMPAFYQSAGVGKDGLLDEGQISIRGPRATNSGCDSYDDEGVAVDNTQLETNKIASYPSVSPYVLDLKYFLSTILRGLVILGRAPGFKRSDVEAAFKSALRIQSLE